MSKTGLLVTTYLFAVCLNNVWAHESPQQALRKGDFAVASAGFAEQLERHRADHAWVVDAARMALYDNRLDEAEQLYRQLEGDQKFRERMLSGLAAVAERRGASDTFVIEQTAQRIAIPFEASEPLPVISLKLGSGRVARFLIDTGAPGVVVDPGLATELGWHIEKGGVGIFGGGARGQIQLTEVPELQLPGMTVHRIPATLMPMEGAPAPEGMKVDGILGTAFFYHFLTTIDFKHHRLILQPRASSASFQQEAAAAHASMARMWYVPDHFIFVRARVNGKAGGLFNIDTGGTGIGIQATSATVRAAHIQLDKRHAGRFLTPGGEVPTWPFSAEVELAGQKLNTTGAYFPKDDQYGFFPFEVAGTLSEELFRRGALTLDFVAMQVVFQSD